MEKVPITFYLKKNAKVTIAVKNKVGKAVWSQTLQASKGFNQVRWDLIREKVDSPDAYFFRYYKFAIPGTYNISVSGEGIDLTGKLTIIQRDKPEL